MFPSNHIFIHIPKTGGSSLKKIFSKYPHITTTEHLHRIPHKPQGYTFAVSRNPYNRILSAYNYLSTGGDQSPNDMAYKINLFPHMSDSVKDFHFFVKNMLNDLSNKQVHLLPMTYFIIGKDNELLINEYFKLEEINEVWSNVQKILNIKDDLIKTNPSRVIKDKNEWLTPEIKDIIYKIYETDFINFDYEK